jgi:hypothetical protein
VFGIEQVDQFEILIGHDRDIDLVHQPSRREVEIVPDHQDRLQSFAIALTQSSDQILFLIDAMGISSLQDD